MLPSRDVVLVGAGHTNLHVVRMWRMRRVAGVRLTLVSSFSRATYSGMLPGTLAGLYGPDEMEIDLWRFCQACGCRLIVAEATGLHPAARQVLLGDRPPIRFDVASIGIGSQPAQAEVWSQNPNVLSIKPMATFPLRLNAGIARASKAKDTSRPLEIVVVGAGAGGTEVLLGIDAHLRHEGVSRTLTIVDANANVLPGYSPGAVRLARTVMERRQVAVITGRKAVRFDERVLQLDDEQEISADLVVWAVGASPPPVLGKMGLPLAADGFLAVRDTLQSTGDDFVFAVGDSATLVSQRLPKAGVYAVREGPVLWDNIQRVLSGRTPRAYRPQRGFLSLLSTGDGRAILDYHGFAFEGRWAWRLKDYIDRKFMRMYQDYSEGERGEGRGERGEAMSPSLRNSQQAIERMRCQGCGGKVGADVLSSALQRVGVPNDGRLRVGLDRPDDAVVLQPAAAPDVLSVDFFEAFLDDPYLVGRIAAIHAMSDLWAMGAAPSGAMAQVSLPSGTAVQQAEMLYQVLAGGVRELAAAGAGLWGGHTTESAEWTIGYTVAGTLRGLEPLTKSGLRPGDVLVLTKPLGTGVLLAAHRLCRCRAAWFDALLGSMLTTNEQAARTARECGVIAATDVTGFGLMGHLAEMLEASGVSARVPLASLPLLEGFEKLAAQEIRSSLDPANRRVEQRLDLPEGLQTEPRYAAMFDPQTSGGLLLAVAPHRAEELIRQLPFAARIGDVTERGKSLCTLLASRER